MEEEKKAILNDEFDANKNHIPRKERVSYLLGLGGQNFIYALVGGSFFSFFLTDIALIPTAILTVVLLLEKVWDGVNDPIIGSIIDKHTFKNGEKLRPFLKLMPIPISIFSVLLFVTFPGGDSLTWLRVTYFVIIYLCWDIAYTLQDVSIWSITAMGTPSSRERENVVKWARTVGSSVYSVAGAIIPMGLEFLVSLTGMSSNIGVLVFAIIFGLGGGLLSMCAYKAKERIPLQEKQEKISDSFKLLKKNKILLLLSLSNLLGSLGFGGSLMTYFFKYIMPAEMLGFDKIPLIGPLLGPLGLTTIYGILTGLPTFLAMLLADKMKKLFKNSFCYLLIGVQLFSAVFRVVAYFIGFEGNMFWISTAVMAIGTFPTGVVGISQTSLFNDSIDLVEWETGKRMEGMTFSMQTFFTKVSSGITQALCMLFLSILSYNGNVEPINGSYIGTQSEMFETWIWPLVMLTPAISSVLYTIPLFFIKYNNKKKKQVENDLQKRREGLPESGLSPYYREILVPRYEVASAEQEYIVNAEEDNSI